jgi:tRNA(Ile2) C34 agmatinyltransferase TiaS
MTAPICEACGSRLAADGQGKCQDCIDREHLERRSWTVGRTQATLFGGDA